MGQSSSRPKLPDADLGNSQIRLFKIHPTKSDREPHIKIDMFSGTIGEDRYCIASYADSWPPDDARMPIEITSRGKLKTPISVYHALLDLRSYESANVKKSAYWLDF